MSAFDLEQTSEAIRARALEMDAKVFSLDNIRHAVNSMKDVEPVKQQQGRNVFQIPVKLRIDEGEFMREALQAIDPSAAISTDSFGRATVAFIAEHLPVQQWLKSVNELALDHPAVGPSTGRA